MFSFGFEKLSQQLQAKSLNEFSYPDVFFAGPVNWPHISIHHWTVAGSFFAPVQFSDVSSTSSSSSSSCSWSLSRSADVSKIQLLDCGQMFRASDLSPLFSFLQIRGSGFFFAAPGVNLYPLETRNDKVQPEILEIYLNN